MIKDKIIRAFQFLNRTDGNLKRETIRSGFWVGLSTVGMSVVNLLKSIILARLLLPEVFGVMAICLIVIRGVEVFTQTGFAAALIHRQDKFEEAKSTAFSLMVNRLFSKV